MIALLPAAWSDRAAADIRRAMEETEGPCGLSDLRADVEAGRARLLAVQVGDQVTGHVVVRVDVWPDGGRELVIVAGGGKGMLAALRHGGELFERLARQWRCASIRTHTTRTGIVRTYEGLGYRTSEIVMRKGVSAHG